MSKSSPLNDIDTGSNQGNISNEGNAVRQNEGDGNSCELDPPEFLEGKEEKVIDDEPEQRSQNDDNGTDVVDRGHR